MINQHKKGMSYSTTYNFLLKDPITMKLGSMDFSCPAQTFFCTTVFMKTKRFRAIRQNLMCEIFFSKIYFFWNISPAFKDTETRPGARHPTGHETSRNVKTSEPAVPYICDVVWNV